MVSTVLPSNSSIVSSVLGLGQSKSACNCFKTATKSSILAARSCSRANQPTYAKNIYNKTRLLQPNIPHTR